ncbi:hypothetical protein [uncultured Nocardioides sp.]|uniref:hypothetical protein n=1 Tax=uncultured Nocardioides sp. TaxID=198441 RepID=UPI00261F84C8|nr:hypothetical protein [uncultured Nocardioides sp.]
MVLPDGEHHATLDTVGWLVAEGGARVRPVGLDAFGRIPVDAFAAALVDGLWTHGLLGGRLPVLTDVVVGDLLAHAARAAAVTVSRPGADPPYRAEL